VFVVWGALIAAAPFAIEGRGGRPFDWWPVIGAGASLVALGCWRLVDRAPRLIVDKDGVSCPPFRIAVPWRHIADATISYYEGTSLLVLVLLDDAPTPSHRPDVPQPPAAFDRDVVLPIAGLELTPERVIEIVRGHIARNLSRDGPSQLPPRSDR
jgi:hypothetical protein